MLIYHIKCYIKNRTLNLLVKPTHKFPWTNIVSHGEKWQVKGIHSCGVLTVVMEARSKKSDIVLLKIALVACEDIWLVW